MKQSTDDEYNLGHKTHTVSLNFALTFSKWLLLSIVDISIMYGTTDKTFKSMITLKTQSTSCIIDKEVELFCFTTQIHNLAQIKVGNLCELM